jgi:hypothetical protein
MNDLTIQGFDGGGYMDVELTLEELNEQLSDEQVAQLLEIRGRKNTQPPIPDEAQWR